MNKIGILHLKCLSESIAEIKVVGSDQPWHICKFFPLESFEVHRKIFSELEIEYRSGAVEDWDRFFAKTVEFGYSLSNDLYSIERYILLWNGDESEVRLRGTLIEST